MDQVRGGGWKGGGSGKGGGGDQGIGLSRYRVFTPNAVAKFLKSVFTPIKSVLHC